MSTTSTDRTSSWLLYGLHIGLALSLPFLLAFLVGCKKVEEEKPDFGPEVDGSAIDQALSKAIRGAHLDNVRVGQYIEYSVNRRLENEENTIALGGTRVEVINRQETETTEKFTLKIFRSERLSGGTFETRVTEEALVLNKSNLMDLQKSSRFNAISASADGRFQPQAKVTKVTYHRLREFTETREAPKAVRERPDCGGLSPCQMEVRFIQFDMVQWHDDGTQTKVSLDFGFSVQPPFLPFGEDFDQFSGLMVIDCRSTYVPIENRTVFVRDCMTLDDFQK